MNNKNQNVNSAKCFRDFIITGKSNSHFHLHYKHQFSLIRFKTNNKNQNVSSAKCLGNFVIAGKSNSYFV